MRNRFGRAAAASGVLAAAAGLARAAEPTNQELLDKINALQAEVRQLRAQQNTAAPKAAPPGAADADATARLVQSDADRHNVRLDAREFGSVWDPNKGFVLRSDDGRYLLHPFAFGQFRYAYNYRENGKHANTDSDSEGGFELPRLKLVLDGNMVSPDLTFQIIWAVNDTTGTLGLQDAWGRYHLPGTPFAVRAGNIRDPFDHEQLLYGTVSLTPERSIVNNVLANGDGIVKGASLGYGFDTDSAFRSEVAFTGGTRNFNTNFQTFPTNPASWGAAGRVEYKVFGDWAAYKQFTALNDKNPLLVIGGGLDYTEAGDAGQFMHVADAQFDSPSGLALYGAYLGRYTRHNAGPPGTNGGATGGTGATADTYDSTFRVMAGYLLPSHWEPFARYEYLHFDGAEVPAGAEHDVVHDITLGANYYLSGHKAKFSAAASYLPNGCPFGNNLGDLLPTKRGNEFILQAQFQLIL